jgi:hypothetical protein
MPRSPFALSGLAWTWALLLAGSARADLIHWSYNWSASPTNIHADAPGTGYITLTDEKPLQVAGDSDIVATNLQVHSTATSASPDVFTNKPYTLTLNLTDQASNQSSSLVFTGTLFGTATADSSDIGNTFTGMTTQKVVLGNNLYTVTINNYAPPGPPGSINSGSIGAHAVVTVQQVIHTLPEPSSLVLCGLGGVVLLVYLGRAYWVSPQRQRRS